jgi:hypothetical protein
LHNIQKLIEIVRDYRRNCLNEAKLSASLQALSATQAHLPDADFLRVREKRENFLNLREKPQKRVVSKKDRQHFKPE